MTTENDVLLSLENTKKASYALQDMAEDQIKTVLRDFAQMLRDNVQQILEANEKDLMKMAADNPFYDRLLLTEERIKAIAADVEHVSDLPSPVGEVIDEMTLANGIDLSRVRVPIGVIAVIYEARPNVTPDVFSLCFRSQNACVLRGGSDAHETNLVLVALTHKVLKAHGVDPDVVYLMPPEREYVPVMLRAHQYVDVCIPRGSQQLIDFVRETASIPVIETGRGVVHIYVDESADLAMAARVIENAKTRRPSVCNALDTLLVHEALAGDMETLLMPLAAKGVRIFANDAAKVALEGFYPSDLLDVADDKSCDTEFMSLQMNVLLVPSAAAAMDHIRRYGSGHTEAILAQDPDVTETFLRRVDASTVMVNASTAFTDGGQFGLGAEIGISTQKLHARGPMGLEALTSYKWFVRGKGQVRPA
ncbi:MAG: glutamate-5-semialdehyde dehydrogenase [Rhodospirillales bacterium]|nr:glutamate-5-semialdehyde dehydrogenase [Rhodospirillales bacterium]